MQAVEDALEEVVVDLSVNFSGAQTYYIETFIYMCAPSTTTSKHYYGFQ